MAKKEVRFGKSITYQVEGDNDSSSQANDSKVEAQKVKNIIEEKDLSDGRDEKERIKELLEKEEQRQKEDMKAMNEWKKKQDEKNKAADKKTAPIPKPT